MIGHQNLRGRGGSDLYPVSWESQQSCRDPGEAHHPPGLGHRAHGPRPQREDDGVESLHRHTGEVQGRADHREILLIVNIIQLS